MDKRFSCTFCSHVFRTIKGYADHCRFHRNECNLSIPCPVQTCQRKFSAYCGFRSHIHRDHGNVSSSTRNQVDQDITLQCSLVFCKQVCSNLKQLNKHLKGHIDDGSNIKCPYNGCENLFKNKSSFSAHLSRQHQSCSMTQLPTIYEEVDMDISNELHPCDNLHGDDGDADELLSLPVTQETKDLYLRNLALFYLKLQSKYLLPASTIQHIMEELQDVHCLGQSFLRHQLILKLQQDADLTGEKIEQIIEDVFQSDMFASCNAGPLRSDYVRKQLYKHMLDYVEPQSFRLGINDSGKECSFQYVPVLESLKCLLQQDSVKKEHLCTMQSASTHDESEYLTDITDGSAFKSNLLFQQHPNSLRLILYQDAFEVCNPIGSSKKKHKLLAVYLTLANFRPHLRSNIDHTLLVLLCKENDFKHFGHVKIFAQLIADLRILENDGIIVDDQVVKGTVCCITGDNLGSHAIGGFTENFSTVAHLCRYCLITFEQFLQEPCHVGTVRTVEKYKSALQQLDQAPDGVKHVEGVKFDSEFNLLSYFHVCQPGLPPCLGHDLFEGIISVDLALFLNHLIKVKHWFTYNDLNRRMAMFKYLGTDANNEPCAVNMQGGKLGGQAAQNWCLLRLLPVIISDKIADPADDVWQIILLLRDIVEFVCAPQITKADVAFLNVLIEEYLEGRKTLFSNTRMRPKHHYLRHYPSLIMHFGPLVRLWTMRFESKHSYFKRCIRYSPNFKNVCLTLAEKHQLLQAYKCAGSYFPCDIEAKQSVPLFVDTFSENVQVALSNFHFDTASQMCYEITVKGTTYKKGLYVVIGKCDNGGLLFGEVLFLVVAPDSSVYFVVRVHKSVYCDEMHLYMIQIGEPHSYRCLSEAELLDYYPLVAYKRRNKLLVPLKHAISYAL